MSLWKDAGARRVELGALSDDAVRALVETALERSRRGGGAALGGGAQPGNPLFARELVLGAVERGPLAFVEAICGGAPAGCRSARRWWSWSHDRLAALTAEQRAPIELLAFGEPLRLPEIASLTSYDVLTEAEAHGLMTIAAVPRSGSRTRSSARSVSD